MASTYRDSAGVERPTQWERAHPSYPGVVDLLTPETRAALERDDRTAREHGEPEIPSGAEWVERGLCLVARVADHAAHVTYMDAWWGQKAATAAYIIERDNLPPIPQEAAVEIDAEMAAYAARLRAEAGGPRRPHRWSKP